MNNGVNGYGINGHGINGHVIVNGITDDEEERARSIRTRKFLAGVLAVMIFVFFVIYPAREPPHPVPRPILSSRDFQEYLRRVQEAQRVVNQQSPSPSKTRGAKYTPLPVTDPRVQKELERLAAIEDRKSKQSARANPYWTRKHNTPAGGKPTGSTAGCHGGDGIHVFDMRSKHGYRWPLELKVECGRCGRPHMMTIDMKEIMRDYYHDPDTVLHLKMEDIYR